MEKEGGFREKERQHTTRRRGTKEVGWKRESKKKIGSKKRKKSSPRA